MIRTSCAARSVQIVNGRAVGVSVQAPEGNLSLKARRGVFISTGGFSHDATLMQQFVATPGHLTMTVDSNAGDGLRMGLAAGGRIGDELYQNFLGYPMSVQQERGGPHVFMHSTMQRSKPGNICVNEKGERLLNEAQPYNDFTHVMRAGQAQRAFFVCDHTHLRRYGLGHVRPGPGWLRPLAGFLSSGYLHRGATVAELARSINVDAGQLELTVARNNQIALAGEDRDFGKGATLHDRQGGDSSHAPHPNLGAIKDGPFYAVEIFEGDLGTYIGLLTDGNARVLDGERRPIEGLYACGLDAHSVFSGTYPSGGSSLGPAMVFGFIAARHLSATT